MNKTNSDKSPVGLNMCFFCLAEAASVVLDRRMAPTLPHKNIHFIEACPKCEDLMKQGVMMISVKDGEMIKVKRDLELAQAEYSRECSRHYRAWKDSHPFNFVPNPYRTGGLAVVKDEAIAEMLDKDVADNILARRYCFVEDADWLAIGLPPLKEVKT